MFTVVTGAAGFIGSRLVAALNRSGIGKILAVDNLENGAKSRNLPGVEIEDYADKMPFKSTGRLEKVTIDLKPEKLGLKDQEELKKAERAAAAKRD